MTPINSGLRISRVRCGTTLSLALAVALGALGASVTLAHPQATTAPATSQPAAPDIDQLLRQRRDAYRQIEQVTRRQVEQGVASPAALHEATIDRLSAELDVAETHAESERLVAAILDELRQEERRVTQAAATGRASEIDALRARVNRIEMEIEVAMDHEAYEEYDD